MMNRTAPVDRELVSALVDGQLRGKEFAAIVAAMSDSHEAVATWHSYHLIGDSLRCTDLSYSRDDLAFVARLRGRLPPAVAARSIHLGGMASELPGAESLPARTDVSSNGFAGRHGANDPVTRWKLFAGVASMVAVSALAWHLLGGPAESGLSPQLAAAPEAGSGPAEPAVMLRDARLDELLAAHRQFGGTSALQMPAGFLRNATFENPGR